MQLIKKIKEIKQAKQLKKIEKIEPINLMKKIKSFQFIMRKQMRIKPLRLVRGFTFLELMIAMVIATLLAMATWISFSATNNANRNQNAVSDIRDNAFYILDRVEYMIRHAGFNHYSDNPADVFGERSAAQTVVSFPEQDNKSNFNQRNDRFAMEMQIPNFNNQEMVGCTGATIPASINTSDRHTLVLYTQGNAAQTQLLCEVLRNGTRIQGPAVMAQNIGRFKVFYRKLSQNAGQFACGAAWQSAQAVGTDFSEVCAVHLSLVVLSAEQTLHSVTQNIQLAPDVASQNADTLFTAGANNALARVARFVPKTIQTRNQ
jgi:prepilin-type N-terminal cleavage/methylation domain-containing protein